MGDQFFEVGTWPVSFDIEIAQWHIFRKKKKFVAAAAAWFENIFQKLLEETFFSSGRKENLWEDGSFGNVDVGSVSLAQQGSVSEALERWGGGLEQTTVSPESLNESAELLRIQLIALIWFCKLRKGNRAVGHAVVFACWYVRSESTDVSFGMLPPPEEMGRKRAK